MKAMRLHQVGSPLRLDEVDVPKPGPRQALVRVSACAVCRTDLHVADGDLRHPELPLILGHEIVGTVEDLGSETAHLSKGDLIGIPWLGWTCGKCDYCRRGEENLCPQAKFTGYTVDGGYAEWAVADERYCLPVSDALDEVHTAPLMCAGLIGYRSLRAAGDADRIGLYGFGAAAHIVAQVIRHQGRSFYAFTRPGDDSGQKFADELGAAWSGGSDQPPPEELDAAILFAPVGELVPIALRAVRPGGRVVCAGIHMSPIPSFPYEILWGERTLCSVANLTRRDGTEFFEIADAAQIRTHVERYPLQEANQALDDLRSGKLRGAAVLVMQSADR